MELDGRSLEELEGIFAGAPGGPAPSGCFEGRFLRWTDAPGARALHVRAVDSLLFRALRFGVDFDAGAWWFVHPRALVGAFRVTSARSRWRDADVLRLEYDESRLPAPIRGYLYDEVRPLDERTLLGIGGVNRGRGDG